MTTQYRHVVMIGMMGVGKSTIGRLVAARLGWGFWDNDDALDAATATTAGDFQRRHGQAALHKIENRLLREALQAHDRTVFAAAASVVLEPELLAGELTVWLRLSLEREHDNIAHSGQHHRPLPEDATTVLQKISAARLPMYKAVADITIEVAGDPVSTRGRVIEALRERGLEVPPPDSSPDPHDVSTRPHG
jgi:shikimate kinase